MNSELRKHLFEELNHKSGGGFLPAVKQVANVASLPGLIGHSIGLPDIHSGYATSTNLSSHYVFSNININIPTAIFFGLSLTLY